MIGDQRQFDRLGLDLGGELGRILADDRDFDQRVAAVEQRQDVGEERLGVVVRNAEPDRAVEALARNRRHRPGLDLDHPPREFD